MTMRARSIRGVFAATLLLAGLACRDARADVCPAPAGAPGVASIDSQERIDYLHRAFDREIGDIDRWSWAWGAVYGAGVVAQGVALVPTTDHGKRIVLEVGAASTGVGFLSLTVLPLKITLPLRTARRHLNDPDPCAALARAEHILESANKDQLLGTGIVGHLGNILVNVGIGLILGLGYNQWTPAVESMVVGIGVGEANAFTQPHHLADVLARYRSGRLDGPDVPPLSVSWSIRPVATPQMTGAALTLAW
jgi:hypothetical protein